MVDRTERILTDADLAKIADTYHAWRGTASTREEGLTYGDEPGFCFSARLETVRERGYLLTPGRYVGAVEAEEEDSEVMTERIAALTEELFHLFKESDRQQDLVAKLLGGLEDANS